MSSSPLWRAGALASPLSTTVVDYGVRRARSPSCARALQRIGHRGRHLHKNVEGSKERRLKHTPGLDGYPSWSPDGQRIAFVSDRASGGNWEIYVMDSDDLHQSASLRPRRTRQYLPRPPTKRISPTAPTSSSVTTRQSGCWTPTAPTGGDSPTAAGPAGLMAASALLKPAGVERPTTDSRS